MKRLCNAFRKSTNGAFVVLALLMFGPAGNNALASEAAPNLTLKTLDNTSIQISDMKGDVIYLDFWATWCPP